MAFSFSGNIVIDHTKVAATLSDFTVLLHITHASLKTTANGGVVTNSSGHDINLFSDSGLTTLLKWDLKYYDATTGEIFVWVKITSLSSTVDTTIYLGAGDSGITTYQGDRANAWDTSTKEYFPLKESTGSTNVGSKGVDTLTPGNSPVQTSGKNDGSLDFNGTNMYTQQTGTGLVGITPSATGFSVSMWVKVDNFAASGGVNRRIFNFYFSTGPVFIQIACSDDAGTAQVIGTRLNYSGSGSVGNGWNNGSALNTGQWYHITFQHENSNFNQFFINGVAASTSGTTTTFGTGSSNNKIVVGARSGPSGYFDGQISDVKIIEGVRSANWILTEYTNQNDPTTFASFTASGSSVNETPGVNTNVIAGYSPTVQTPQNVNTSLGEQTITGSAPTVQTPQNVQTDVGSQVINGFSPSVSTPNNIQTNVGEQVINGFAPDVLTAVNITTDVGFNTIDGYSPTVSLPVNIQTDLGTQVIDGYSPFVSTATNVVPFTGEQVITGFAPSVQTPVNVTTDLGVQTINGFTPSAQTPVNITPDVGNIQIDGYAPSVIAGANVNISTGLGQSYWDGYTPTVSAVVTILPSSSFIIYAQTIAQSNFIIYEKTIPQSNFTM